MFLVGFVAGCMGFVEVFFVICGVLKVSLLIRFGLGIELCLLFVFFCVMVVSLYELMILEGVDVVVVLVWCESYF